MKNVRILLTGASGYIGRATYLELKKQGFINILCTDIENIFDYENFFQVDLSEQTSFSQLGYFAPEVIIHLAALKSIPESRRDPQKYLHSNPIMTKNVLELADNFNSSVIHSSTSGVYYDNSAYSISKQKCEESLRNSNINYINLRYFNVAGLVEYPTEKQKGNLMDILREKYKNKDTFFINKNTKKRFYVHVEDVAKDNVRAVELVLSKQCRFDADVFSYNELSVVDILKILKSKGIEISTSISDSPIEKDLYPQTISQYFTPESRKSMMDIIDSEIKYGFFS